jgi:radical SAM protein with 4Fe4S-binding SPASM domain
MLSYPISIKLNITKNCNLRCNHCFIDEYKKEIPLRIAKLLIDDFEENKLQFLLITGGEPLVYKNIFKLLEYIRAKNINCSLATNGTLIDENIASKLRTLHIKFVQVSLDGSRKAHDQIRGQGSYDKAISGIKKLVKKNIQVIIAHVITRVNKDDIEKILIIASNVGVKDVRFELYLPINTDISKDNLFIKSRDIITIYQNLSSLEEKYKGINIEKPIFKSKYGCGAGVFHCVINPDLTVSPCDLLSEKFYTSRFINKNTSVRELWNNSKLFNNWRNMKIRVGSDCENCDKESICGYGCRAASLAYLKKLEVSDPICMTKFEGGKDNVTVINNNLSY